MGLTTADAMLNTLLNALEDSAAGYAYVAEEADGFALYAHSDFQAFERHRLARLLASRGAAPGASADEAGGIVHLRIARVHGDDAVIGQLQRNDARLSHMLQASMADGALSGEIGRTVRSIGNAIADAQAELSLLSRRARTAPNAEARAISQAA